MKIKMWETQRKEVEVDVEFPIYREHDVTPDYAPSIIIYTKIIENGDKLEAYSITLVGNGMKGCEIEINKNYRFDDSNVKYNLGLGEYASSTADFNDAVNIAKQLINSI